tara:strand:+ start:159 stop:401 length:243 start_codon:yes stop_codon:yes gene_type:complete
MVFDQNLPHHTHGYPEKDSMLPRSTGLYQISFHLGQERVPRLPEQLGGRGWLGDDVSTRQIQDSQGLHAEEVGQKSYFAR